ncbi:Pro-kumamolisin, activation domain-containing protein, partial [Ochromonadaceae sp. CCMP2298]
MEGDAKHGKAWRALNTLKSASQETTRLELTFALNLRNGQALHDTLMKVSAPSSADYGKLLTHVEVDALTRPAAEAVDTVLAYLQTHGVTGQVRGGFVRASVDLATAEKLLSARYAPYAHS